ncbi:MAG TPA: Xaa-Pro peptidase family protein [Terriglobales bacterium]|nr:Xaa-Pro peptidase family protein [Terriglobales bacterium]
MRYQVRQQRLLELLRRHQASGLLVTSLVNIRYLCGFTGSSGVLACRLDHGRRQLALFTDGRYRLQAREEVTGARIVIEKRSALEMAAEWVTGSGLTPIAIEAQHLSVAERDLVLKHRRHPNSRLKSTVGLIEQLRLVKDDQEMAAIRSAVNLGASLFDTALNTIRPGVAEVRVAAEMEHAARESGAEGMSFETIVAAGPRSALPHGHASTKPIPGRGFVVLDFGVILAGYCSDMTRTVHVGRPTTEEREMYEAVREAQGAGVDAVRAGVTAGEVDFAARSVLRRNRLDRFFTHSTGHGVGLEIHEPPRLARREAEVLQPGMVVTIEPGVYVPGKGGVRIEDMVVVRENGCEVLTPGTKELIEL